MTAVLTVRVADVWMEAVGVRAFKLVPLAGERLPPYEPGSHIDLHIGPGLIRQYSLCNGPDDTDHYLIAVKRETNSRGGSTRLHEVVGPGDRIVIGAPRNNFMLQPDAERFVLIAGGIGVTPLLSMARHLCSSNRAFEMHYFTRSMHHAAFKGLLAAREFAGRVRFVCGTDIDWIRGRLCEILAQRSAGAHLYLCGPAEFMAEAQGASGQNWPRSAVHLEHFSNDLVTAPAPARAFTVKLARSGREFVIPADKSIVEVLTANDVWVDYSCAEGICGTCVVDFIGGTPDHRDLVLSDNEKSSGRKIALCVSRAKTDVLVLDL